MKKLRDLTLALGAIFSIAAVAYVVPASAQATRTWVSGVGSDANPCSRTAPCQTFAGAISKTATNGEINCLDPGGFGGVTITKAISIVCNYTEGGVLSAGAGVNGIVVNAPAASHVYLRGLDLHGAGSAQNGLRVIAGASVTLEDSVIRSYNAASGNGISFQPSAATRLNLNNVTINNNSSSGNGAGILIQPTGAGGTARVAMHNVRIESNVNIGMLVNTTGNTNANGVGVEVVNSSFSNNVIGIQALTAVGSAVIVVTVIDSSVSNNSTTGMISNGANAFLRVGNTTITGNAQGVSSVNSGTIETYGNNRLVSNPTVGGFNNGAFTGAAPPPQ